MEPIFGILISFNIPAQASIRRANKPHMSNIKRCQRGIKLRIDLQKVFIELAIQFSSSVYSTSREIKKWSKLERRVFLVDRLQ